MERHFATTVSVALVLFAPPLVFAQNEEQVKSLMQQSSDYIQKERAKPPYR